MRTLALLLLSVSAALAQPESVKERAIPVPQTPGEEALVRRITAEVNQNLACTTAQITLARQLDELQKQFDKNKIELEDLKRAKSK